MDPLEYLSLGGLIFQLGAYLAFGFLLVSSWGRERAQAMIGAFFAAAAGIGLLDAIAHLLASWLDPALPAAIDRLQVIGWLVVLAFIALGERRFLHPPSMTAGFVVACLALIAGPWAHLLLLLAGFVLIERTWRQSDFDQRHALKLMLIGLSTAFAADLVIVLDALAGSRGQEALQPARPFMMALAVPLVAASIARRPEWELDIHVGRKAVFGGVIAVSAALYTLAAFAFGAAAREATGNAGPAIQAIIVLTMLAGGCIVFLSGQVHTAVITYVSRTFFSYRFDYRDEWVRFVRTLEGNGMRNADSLPDRVVFAVADVVDATGGAIWLARPRGAFRLLAVRNLELGPLREGVDEGLAGIISGPDESRWLVDLGDGEDERARRMPEWIPAHPHGWLVLPLCHREKLFGIMVLAEPRVSRRLDGEERELLGVVAREAASYLAEDQAARRLTEVERFESFNRRFAFVMHDVKNVSAQLALTLSNARRHRGNDRFYDDMLGTLGASVTRMNALISRLRNGEEVVAVLRLDELLAGLAAEHGDVRIAGILHRTEVRADPVRLRSALSNLVYNARESCAGDRGGNMDRTVDVEIRLETRDGEAVIEVRDNGPGMDPAFVETGLFEPFTTTKSGGMGLGMAGVKETIETMGGRLEVETALGVGSTMRVRLPVLEFLGAR
ncbi:MAG: PEP-CTERM system histidine kinase PrsK [Geminicoccaceae bacterium]